jgi:predicted SnoaL-like aldol condensation-catalyzing enzyme
MSKSNKEIAISFQKLIVKGKIREAYNNYVAPNMQHHNAFFSGDADSLQKGMEENHQTYPNKVFELQHTIAEGELVMIHSRIRMEPEDRGMAAVHIFRFESDHIAEMWDLVQSVPEESPNENEMF